MPRSLGNFFISCSIPPSPIVGDSEFTSRRLTLARATPCWEPGCPHGSREMALCESWKHDFTIKPPRLMVGSITLIQSCKLQTSYAFQFFTSHFAIMTFPRPFKNSHGPNVDSMSDPLGQGLLQFGAKTDKSLECNESNATFIQCLW